MLFSRHSEKVRAETQKGQLMPAKKTHLTDAERAKRIREAAKKAEASNDPKEFDRVFKAVIRPKNVKRHA